MEAWAPQPRKPGHRRNVVLNFQKWITWGRLLSCLWLCCLSGLLLRGKKRQKGCEIHFKGDHCPSAPLLCWLLFGSSLSVFFGCKIKMLLQTWAFPCDWLCRQHHPSGGWSCACFAGEQTLFSFHWSLSFRESWGHRHHRHQHRYLLTIALLSHLTRHS